MIFDVNLDIDKFLNKIIIALTNFFTPDRIMLIGSIIIVTLIGYNILSIFLGYSLLHPTNLIINQQRKTRQEAFKKNYKHLYRNLINRVIAFKDKHNLNLTSSFMENKKNIILERCGVVLFKGDNKVINIKEFNANNNIKTVIALVIFILTVVITKLPIRILLVILLLYLIYLYYIKFQNYNSMIKEQDKIFDDNFESFYLTQHSILLYNTKNPLSLGLTLYKEKCSNAFMNNWIDYSLKLISLYSESVIVDKYLVLYSTHAYMYKLLSIQKQILVGSIDRAQIAMEGLREQILKNKEIKATQLAKQRVGIINVISYIVLLVLFQACIGVIIYLLVYFNKI